MFLFSKTTKLLHKAAYLTMLLGGLLVVPMACAEDTNPVTSAIATLRDNPSDKALLTKLKTSLVSLTNRDERCAPGMLYCLGCLTVGDISEGMRVREQLLKAYPNNPQVAELSDSSITEPCTHCVAGKTFIACAKCNGTGICPLCNGSGQSTVQGFHGQAMRCVSCDGTGKCPECGGAGKIQCICSVCGGRGTVLSQLKCQQAYIRLLQPTTTMPLVLGTSSNKTVPPSPPNGPTIIGGYIIPILPPPVAGPVDPDVKAVFDKILRADLAQRVQTLIDNDARTYTTPAFRQQLIKEHQLAWAKDTHEAEVFAAWQQATQLVERQNTANEHQAAEDAEEKRQQAEKVRRTTEEQAKQGAMDQAVKTALENMQAQIARSELLTKYPITKDDINRVRSWKYTTVQRQQAFAELWGRAWVHPTCKDMRALFMPIPNGLNFSVWDVLTIDAKGDYEVVLISDKGERETHRKIETAIGLHLSYFNLFIPKDDPAVANLKKGQIITSDAWFGRVVLNANGEIKVDDVSYRSDVDFQHEFNTVAATTNPAEPSSSQPNSPLSQVDIPKDVKLFQKAADQGDADAQLKLGVCYVNGNGVSVDKGEAAKWFRKAADQGNAKAQYDLGCCYANGDGVPVDMAEAVKWFRKAADQGNVDAQNKLGFYCFFGYGVATNKVDGVKWFRLAANQGYAAAQFSLGGCYANGDGVAMDKAEAAKWFRKAADQGDMGAQYALGLCSPQLIEWRMKCIVLPDISCNNAKITDVIAFFNSASREYDDLFLPAEKRGVNFVLKNTSVTSGSAHAPTAPTPATANDGTPPITFNARFVSLWDALKIVTGLTGYNSQVTSNAVIIMPTNVTTKTASKEIQ